MQSFMDFQLLLFMFLDFSNLDFGADALNVYRQTWFNIIFFVLLVVLRLIFGCI
jgi:hypothetical protein